MVLDLCACEKESYKVTYEVQYSRPTKLNKLSIFKHTFSTKMPPQVFRKVTYKPNLLPFTRIICKEFQQREEPFL